MAGLQIKLTVERYNWCILQNFRIKVNCGLNDAVLLRSGLWNDSVADYKMSGVLGISQQTRILKITQTDGYCSMTPWNQISAAHAWTLRGRAEISPISSSTDTGKTRGN